jgi:putative GTP pyrophosphokinase
MEQENVNISNNLPQQLVGQDVEALMNQLLNFRELLMMYQCAIKEIRTKLEILNEEFKAKEQRNPIETIKDRVKSPMSIYDKAMQASV